MTECEADHSLPSADDGSSGYESFALKERGSGSGNESGGECESPGGETSPGNTPPRKSPSLYNSLFNTAPTIGLQSISLLQFYSYLAVKWF